jgi:hypothetical protein
LAAAAHVVGAEALVSADAGFARRPPTPECRKLTGRSRSLCWPRQDPICFGAGGAVTEIPWRRETPPDWVAKIEQWSVDDTDPDPTAWTIELRFGFSGEKSLFTKHRYIVECRCGVVHTEGRVGCGREGRIELTD